jgi:hypothetical protein
MSSCSHQTMINHHELGLFGQLGETLHVWAERRRQRFELTCMMSACRGAMSLAKPKSRFGGRKAARAGAAS